MYPLLSRGRDGVPGEVRVVFRLHRRSAFKRNIYILFVKEVGVGASPGPRLLRLGTSMIVSLTKAHLWRRETVNERSNKISVVKITINVLRKITVTLV